MINKIIWFFLHNRLVVFLLILAVLAGGIIVSPFQWNAGFLPSLPVAVDALPDLGENQQLIFTEWDGRSPQNIEDQITYPLTTVLLGLPGVKDIRSSSMMGFSSISVIFEDDIEFYWSRARILEKLSSLPADLLPEGVKPTLGPDATGLGQIFWYTIEGRDAEGNPAGGWDLHEIRSVQDFFVKYALSAVEGVSEVASAGGNVLEYQVDVDPSALRKYGISIADVADVLRRSNRDVGAKTIEINKAEYLVRGLGTIRSLEDIEEAVLKEVNSVPVKIGQVASVKKGPAPKRGALDKDGAEAAGGVVISRYGANAMQVIASVKSKIEEIQSAMPSKMLGDGTLSRLTIVPFYDRSELIAETLHTLNQALALQVLITVLVIVVMVYNLRASLVISALLPLGILITFMAMKLFKVEANIVALSGIAIVIGTMVDLGIILCENVLKKINEEPDLTLSEQIYEGAKEVSSAIVTAVSTTVVSFLPVFSLQAAEGKLFGPLAYTKTFALIAALLVTLLILPALFYWFFNIRVTARKYRRAAYAFLGLTAAFGFAYGIIIPSALLLLFLTAGVLKKRFPAPFTKKWAAFVWEHIHLMLVLLIVCGYLSSYWMPLGAGKSLVLNFIFVGVMAALVLGFFLGIQFSYLHILRWCLENKLLFLSIPAGLTGLGLIIWFGFPRVFGFVETGFEKAGIELKSNRIWTAAAHAFPGMGNEFMPALDEGTFLLMPGSMPHSGVEYNQEVLAQLDMLVSAIPEVETAVGKLGRAETAMDPAPISMFENIIHYKDEYYSQNGELQKFKTDGDGKFITKSGKKLTNDELLEQGYQPEDLVADNRGSFFRNWRTHIKTPDDIWSEITRAAEIPGVTSAPKLQPIETRNLMLQTGMNAPMGIKIHGPDLGAIESFGLQLETFLKQVPGVKAEAVFAERIVGKPYLNLVIDRQKLGRYGLTADDVQTTIELAVGGTAVTTTIEGRERYAVRVRYPAELRDSPEEIGNILVTNNNGLHIPLSEVVNIEYEQGPQEIRSENTFLTSHVLFDKMPGFAEIEVADNVLKMIESRINDGTLMQPPGVTYELAGNYKNQVRAQKRFAFIIPLVLGVIFLILYFQFRRISTAVIVFSSIALAFSGGFLLLWLYSQGWFMNFSIFDVSMQQLFGIHTVNLSVAVWVGFIALFGLATDDGVLMATYLDQSFASKKPASLSEVREQVLLGAEKRIRPAVMTAATTIIALLPVLTSSGRGADIMIPMAIPAFGGMLMTCITFYVVPVLYSMIKEREFKRKSL